MTKLHVPAARAAKIEAGVAPLPQHDGSACGHLVAAASGRSESPEPVRGNLAKARFAKPRHGMKAAGHRAVEPGDGHDGLAQGTDGGTDAAPAAASGTAPAGLSDRAVDRADARSGSGAADPAGAEQAKAHHGGSVLPYALGGLALIGGGVAAAGGGSASSPTPKTPAAVDTPSLALAADTGGSATDGITSRGTIAVSSLQTGAKWEYSTDNGTTWSAGTGSSFILPQGSYAAGSIQVRQTDLTGTVSAAGKLAAAVTVDTSTPSPTINPVAGDNVLTLAEAADPAGVTVTGTAEANATVSLTWRTPGADTMASVSVQADAAGAWRYTFKGSGIPDAKILQETTLMVSATDVAGNASDIVRRTVTTDPGLTVSGRITAGAVVAGNDLTVSIFNGAGKLLASGVKVAADGTFSVANVPAVKGDVLIARLINGPAPDYLDETTGKATNLSAALLAAVTADSAATTVNINPLTTLAAGILGIAASGDGGITGTAAAAATEAANRTTAKALGLGSSSLVALAPEVIPSAGFPAGAALTPAQQAGAVLAALSGLDARNGGNAQATIDALVPLLTSSGTGAGKSLPELLVLGAQSASARVGTALVSQVAGVLATTAAAGSLTIAPVAGDDIVNRNEAGSLTITGKVAAGATAVSVALGGKTFAATLDGGNWKLALGANDLAGVESTGVLMLQAQATLADGSTTDASRAVLFANAAPPAPTIDAVLGDDLVSKTDRAAGVLVTGKAAAGTTVAIAWDGAAVRQEVVSASGDWQTRFQPGDLPATDRISTITAVATDRFGNTGAPGNRAATVDLTAPDKPVVAAVNGLDIISPASAKAGVEVTGTGEPGGKAVLSWPGGKAREVDIDKNGRWTTSFAAADLPADGSQVLTVYQVDPAGNTGAGATRTVQVAQNATGLVLGQIAGGDGVNLAEAGAGVVVNGVATPGSSLVLSWAGADPKRVVVGDTGIWSATYAFGDVPTDGVRKLTVSGTDAKGASLEPVTRDILIDTQQPLGSAIDVVAGDDIVNNAEKAAGVEVIGAGEPGASVRVVWGRAVRTETVTSGGTWRVVFGKDDIPSDSADEPITASVTDALGNTSVTPPRLVSIQTVRPAAPTLALKSDTGANARDGVTADGRVVVSGLVAGGTWEFTTDGGSTWLSGTRSGQKFSDGTFGFRLSDDTYTPGLVQVRQTDTTGNRSDEAKIASGLTIKSTLPVLALDRITADERVNAQEKAEGIKLTGQVTNMVDGIPVTVKVSWIAADGAKVTRDAIFTSQDDWEVTFRANEMPANDGRSTVTVEAVDSVGNFATTLKRLVDIKTSLPGKPSLMLSGDSGVSSTDGITNNPRLGVNDIASGQRWEYSLDSGATWQPGSFGSGTIMLEEGRYEANTIWVRQVDVFENRGAVVVYDKPLVIDSRIGEPTIDPIGMDGMINAALKQNGVTISGTAEVGATVSLTWHGKVYTASSVAVDATAEGRWSIDLPSAEIPGDGVSQVKVTASDLANNRSSTAGVTRLVTVDTKLPAAPIINMVTQDDVISAAERGAGITITGRTDLGTRVNVTLGNIVKEAQVNDKGEWKVFYSAAELPSDAAKVAISATAQATNAAANSSLPGERFVEIDTVTSDPVIDAPGGTISINAAQRAAGLTITGSAEANAIVVLTLGGQSQSTTADANGKWRASFLSGLLPSDGQTSLVAQAIDAKGNVSRSVTTPVVLDTAVPAVPRINTIAEDNIVTPTEAAAPLVVRGSAERGAKVTLYWGSTKVPVEMAADGSWTAQVTVAPDAATRNVVVAATVTDAAGNESRSFTRTVLIAGTSETGPVIAPVATDDRINGDERSAGIRVNGLAAPNSLLYLYADGVAVGQVSVLPNGQWANSFSDTALPLSGSLVLTLKSGTDILYTRQVMVDPLAPAAPVITDVGAATAAGPADLVLAAAEKATGLVRVSGTVDALAVVEVQWGGVIKSVIADATGKWFADFRSGEVPPSGDSTLKAFATDTAGNVGATATAVIRVATDVTGGAGNDILTGTGYGDVLTGGAGNDTLVVPDLTFRKIEGGDGYDTLKFGTAVKGATLDLTRLAAGQVSGIEDISMAGGGGGNHLVVDAASIMADTGAGKLVVSGSADDRITAFGFSKGGTASADGQLYTIFTSGSATLWVDQSIQHIVI